MTSSPVVPFDSGPAEVPSSGRGLRKLQSTVADWEGNPEDLAPGMIPLVDFPIRKGRSIKIKGENNTVIDILSMEDNEMPLESTDIAGPSDGQWSQPSSSRGVKGVGSPPASSRGVKGYSRMPSRSANLLSRVGSLMSRGSPKESIAEKHVPEDPKESTAEEHVQEDPEDPGTRQRRDARASFDGPANLASAALLNNMNTGARKKKLLPSHSTNRSTTMLSKPRLSAIANWVPTPESSQRGPSLHTQLSFGRYIRALAGPPSDIDRFELETPLSYYYKEGGSTLSRRSTFFVEEVRVPVIHPLSTISQVWDRLLWITVIANSLIWPVRLAFYWEDMDEEFLSHTKDWRWAWLGYLTNFVLVTDVVLRFNIGYVREHDYVCMMDRRRIALRYFRGRFWLDFLTSLPTHTLWHYGSLAMAQWLRIYEIFIEILRIDRAYRARDRLRMCRSAHASQSRFRQRIMSWLFTAILFLHWNSCTQYLIAAATGYPDGCWVEVLGLMDDPVYRKYIWSVYNAASQMLAIGYGPVDPVIDQEIIVVMISFIASTLLFPILASIITTTLISMDSLREEYQRQVDSWDQYMAHRRLPLALRRRIRAAMDYRWRTRRAINEDALMENLPPAIQLDVKMHLCENIVHEVPLFQSANAGAVRSIAACLTQEIYMEGDWIVREGQVGREMYFIHSGTVDVYSEGELIQQLCKKDYFGQVAMMKAGVRTASCRANTTCEVSVLSGADLREVLDDFPDLKAELEEAAERQVVRDIRRDYNSLSNSIGDRQSIASRAHSYSVHASHGGLSTIKEGKSNSSSRLSLGATLRGESVPSQPRPSMSQDLSGFVISADSFAGAPTHPSSNGWQ